MANIYLPMQKNMFFYCSFCFKAQNDTLFSAKNDLQGEKMKPTGLRSNNNSLEAEIKIYSQFFKSQY